jgi:hypothetical protein
VERAGAQRSVPSGHTRAFVAVQNGCDHCCTFCVIPQGRGASRSLGRRRRVARSRAASRPGSDRGRADRGRHDQLGARSPREPSARQARAGRSSMRFQSLAACACPRSTESRSTPSCSSCWRTKTA